MASIEPVVAIGIDFSPNFRYQEANFPHLLRFQSKPWMVTTVRIPSMCGKKVISAGPSA